MSVYDARTAIGRYVATATGFLVYASDGTLLTACHTRREAQDALYQAYIGEARP